jgi:membrane protease YdiL (CAAX protease family)
MQSLAFLSARKKFVVSGLAVFVSICLYYFFPADDRLSPVAQSAILGAAFLLLVPMLYVRIVLKEPLRSLGFRNSDRSFGWFFVIAAVISASALFVLLVKEFPVKEHYDLSFAQNSFLMFLLYEVVLVGFTAFLFEVFFRGFVMLLWLRKYGWWTVLFQAVLFIGFFRLANGSLSWQESPIFIVALFSGFVAFYTRSVWYSFVSSWVFLVIADAYLLAIR